MPTLTDLYGILFGKNHIQDGDVISMAEHGRAGGVSTGTAFKGMQEIPLAIEVDDVTTANITYIGEAAPGSATTDPVWRIRKVDETIGTVVTFANGKDKFDNLWTSRVSLSYS